MIFHFLQHSTDQKLTGVYCAFLPIIAVLLSTSGNVNPMAYAVTELNYFFVEQQLTEVNHGVPLYYGIWIINHMLPYDPLCWCILR